jgi:hypothetical protein
MFLEAQSIGNWMLPSSGKTIAAPTLLIPTGPLIVFLETLDDGKVQNKFLPSAVYHRQNALELISAREPIHAHTTKPMKLLYS